MLMPEGHAEIFFKFCYVKLCQVIPCLKNSPLSHVPLLNVLELRKGTYKHIGEFIALSVMHGGPGPHCFSKAVADYFLFGLQKVHGDLDDIPDKIVREKVEKACYTSINYSDLYIVVKVSDDEKYVNILDSEEYDFRYDCGLHQPGIVYSKEKDDFISSVITHYAVV